MRIGSLLGVDINISIFLVGLSVVAVIFGNGSEMATIFFVFIGHEASHVIVARLLKMEVSSIELLPFGGAIRIKSIFELNPINEILVAIAGPSFNIIIVLVYSTLLNLGIIHPRGNEIFLRANLILAGFNLLPALPLDGGRILRALLSREIGLKRATNIASYGGIVLSLFLVGTGIYGIYMGTFNPNFFILSGFLAYSAIKEKRTASYILIRDITYKKGLLSKEGLLVTRELVVLYNMPLKVVLKGFVPHRYHNIKIVDHSLKIWGYLDEADIINAMVDYGSNIEIGRLLGQL